MQVNLTTIQIFRAMNIKIITKSIMATLKTFDYDL